MATMRAAPSIEQALEGLDLHRTTREVLLGMARRRAAPTHELLLRKGATTTALSILLTGRAALIEDPPGPGVIKHLLLRPGDIFGWSAVVEPFQAVSDVLSLSQVDLVTFDAKTLRAAMVADPIVAADVRGIVVTALADRLIATRHELFDLHGAGWAQPIYEPW